MWTAKTDEYDLDHSMCAYVLRLDGEVSAVVNAQKHTIDPTTICATLAGEVTRLVRQMGLGTGANEVEQWDRVPVAESVKPGFTRVAGSIRRRVNG